ncbi:MAG TPA: sigma-70 family RNA polymerase sigma factor [Acidimicrobiales bacterium]
METGQVADAVVRARGGDREAWAALARHHLPLVHATCRCFRLTRDDAEAVNQLVWLRLAEELPRLRAPAAVGGWIAAVTRGECLRVLRDRGRIVAPGDDVGTHVAAPTDTGLDPGPAADAGERELLAAFGQLDLACQRLVRLLATDPAPGLEAVGAALDLPVGDVGPAGDRCLAQLRRALLAGGTR